MTDFLKVVGPTALGALVGFVGGFVIGEREGGDFNFAPAIYAPVGAAIGAIAGAVAGGLWVS